MNKTLQQKLDQINKLQVEIEECENVLDIFNHKTNVDTNDGYQEEEIIDLKPKLIIQHQTVNFPEAKKLTNVPGALSKDLTTLIERHVNMIKNGNIELLSTLLK